MASIETSISLRELMTSQGVLDAIMRQVETIKGLTVYQTTQTAGMLIRWELSEFDPYFVHEDF